MQVTIFVSEVRKDYKSWTAKHNATLDGSIPVNSSDDYDRGNDSDDETNSGAKLRAYAAEAPPENVLEKFVIALGRFEPLQRWLLVTDSEDEDTEPNDILYHKTCFCPLNFLLRPSNMHIFFLSSFCSLI